MRLCLDCLAIKERKRFIVIVVNMSGRNTKGFPII